jgi:hypothetical protein
LGVGIILKKMKKYRVLYCGKKLDIVEAKNEKEAINKTRAEFNFEAVDDEVEKKKKEDERIKQWELKKCECGYPLVKHITRNNHIYWICSKCSDKFCYNDKGKKDFAHTKWCQDDFC